MKRLLFLAITCVLALASCGKPSSVSSSLTTVESQKLTDALTRLENVLKPKAPNQYAHLASGATSTEIGRLRASLNGSTIEALEMWFQWHNGASGGDSVLLPLGHAISIDQSLAHRKMEASIPLIDGLRKGSIKILDDFAGDGFFIDTTSTTPLVFYHMLEDPYPTYYGTLTEFVEFIAIGFEKGILYEDTHGNFAYDEKLYTAYEATHLAKASRP